MRGWLAHRWRRWTMRRFWERCWGRGDFAPAWLGRDVSREIVAATNDGWFPRGARALDIGCGQGEVASWLAAHGFTVVGIDISAAAIARARELHGAVHGRLEFRQLDICAAGPDDGPYEVLIDRGCFHAIPQADAPHYARHVAGACRSGARLLLLVKAFRDGVPLGDPLDRARVVARVEAALAREFSIDRVAETHLDPHEGRRPESSLPGLVCWMTRR